MATPSEKQKVADGGMVIPCTSDTFIRAWLEVLRPIHKLSYREMNIAAHIINKWFILSREVKNREVINVDRLLLNKEGRKELCEELGITPTYLRMVLATLKRREVLIGDKINPKYLPNWEPGRPFRWVFIFENALG